uniref:Secreted protein n=2 Tax=Ursus TaxID=9639 RepID=A0A452V4Y6_URSMA
MASCVMGLACWCLVGWWSMGNTATTSTSSRQAGGNGRDSKQRRPKMGPLHVLGLGTASPLWATNATCLGVWPTIARTPRTTFQGEALSSSCGIMRVGVLSHIPANPTVSSLFIL